MKRLFQTGPLVETSPLVETAPIAETSPSLEAFNHRRRPPTRPLQTATLGLVSCAIALALACACRDKPSPEEEVRATVRRAIEGANDRSVSKVVKDALPSFRGPRGQNLAECRQILLGYFMRQGWTRAFERNLDIEVEGARARAVLDVVLAQGKPVERLEDLLPTQANELIFELELVLHEGGWKFESAEYEHKRP